MSNSTTLDVRFGKGEQGSHAWSIRAEYRRQSGDGSPDEAFGQLLQQALYPGVGALIVQLDYDCRFQRACPDRRRDGYNAVRPERPRPPPAIDLTAESLEIEHRERLWIGRFTCMASPCEILVDGGAREAARALIEHGRAEAMRIERKFSRYRDDNVIHRINRGERVAVDDETARLFDFADQCYELSDGLFDVTSGILRRAWRFAPGARPPAQAELDALLPRIGWRKVRWEPPVFQLPPGMEIDLGGIGKEYAVDRIVTLLRGQSQRAFLVNLGGDCHAGGPRADGAAWITGIENPDRPGDADAVIRIERGALATSGDAHRFILHAGRRYGHVIDPRSGWPARDAPRSVTVAAATCTEAGILSTLALLHGDDAEAFLGKQGVEYWCSR